MMSTETNELSEQLIPIRTTRLSPVLLFSLFAILFIGNNTLQAKEYIIGVEDVSYYPFYDFSAKDLEQDSFSKALLSSFFRYRGYQFKFVALPLKRFDKWYLEEAIDFKFPDNVRWQTEQLKDLNIIYSRPVLQLTAGSYVLKKNQNLPRAAIKRLGTILGFIPTLWYDRIENNTLELVEASSSYSLIKHLLHGNVEAVNIDKNVIDYNLALFLKNSDDVVLNEHTKHERYAFHLSTIFHPEIMLEFDQFLRTHNQLVTEMKQKYGIIEASENH
tara:strand:- start:5392 stop:6213 length:822 start_codon:yes stop_codon:yes gene_type:complete